MVFRFYSKVLSKCRICHFRDPKFKYFLVENLPGPPYICHHFVGAQMFFLHRGPHTHSAATEWKDSWIDKQKYGWNLCTLTCDWWAVLSIKAKSFHQWFSLIQPHISLFHNHKIVFAMFLIPVEDFNNMDKLTNYQIYDFTKRIKFTLGFA